MAFTSKILILLGVFWILEKLSPYLHRILRDKLTAADDIPLLGLPRKTGRKIQGTAVICGGSIAGLLTARVCSDHFEKVIMVEPEAWVTTDEGQVDRHREAYYTTGSTLPKRSRIAQYNHIHIFHAFTTLSLRKLFSDFDEVMERAGGRFYTIAYRYHILGIPWRAPYAKETKGIPTALHSTRPAYETGLRKLVLSHCSNVEYVVGSVTGVVPHQSKKTLTSVLVKSHASDDDTVTKIPATIVIDCTGPARGGLRWLNDAGFHAAPTSGTDDKPVPLDTLKVSYDPKVAYSTCEYHIPPALREELKKACLPLDYDNIGVLFTNLAVPYTDGSTLSIQRREDDYMQFMCGAADYRERITCVDDIRQFYAKIPVAQPFPAFIYSLLDFLEKHEIPATYVHSRSSAPQYVQYYRAQQLPSNFIALGDAVLQLNPIRGQGCTSACVDAVTLNALLSRTTTVSSGGEGEALPEGFGRTFFSMQSQRSGGQWQARKIDDYAWPATIPEAGEYLNSRAALIQGWLSVKFLHLATKDNQFAWDFFHVEHYLAPPTDLFTPKMLAKVLWLHIVQTLGF